MCLFVYQSRLSLAKVSLEPGDAPIHRRNCSEMEEGVKLSFCKSINGYLSWKMAPYLLEDVRAAIFDTGRLRNNTGLRREPLLWGASINAAVWPGRPFCWHSSEVKRWLWMRCAGRRDWVTPDGPSGSPSQMDLDLMPGRTYWMP